MNKGIHTRGYLPHWDFPGSLQAVTFRLQDSVPVAVIREWKQELSAVVNDKARELELHRMIAHYEDAGHGDVLFRNAECARIMQDSLIAGHPERYKLIDWCVMPNHVHVLCKLAPGAILGEVIRQWKGGSSRKINILLGTTGTVWMPDYHDRLVRNLDHFHECRAYIRNNPVKANLCEKPENWTFSSAGVRWDSERGLQSVSNPPGAD